MLKRNVALNGDKAIPFERTGWKDDDSTLGRFRIDIIDHNIGAMLAQGYGIGFAQTVSGTETKARREAKLFIKINSNPKIRPRDASFETKFLGR